MSTRYRCPQCEQDKRFCLYIDTQTGEHLSPDVGKCNRESNCGYHYTPKQYFADNPTPFDTPHPTAYKPRAVAPQKQPQKPVSFIDVAVFIASLKEYETNCFVQYLINLFGHEVATQLVSRYFIGTAKRWDGATVFWQIDTQRSVRTGKIMLYNPTTGKRVKEPNNCIYWAHTALKQPEFELKQCLFGEHLLMLPENKQKPVAVVESEKTAIIASVYFPQFVWVSVGSLTNLNAERCGALKGRNVTLFPDLNGFDKWSSKAKELTHIATFIVSDLLERIATETERAQGLDVADYLTRFYYKEFAQPQPTYVNVPSQLIPSQPEPSQSTPTITTPSQPRPAVQMVIAAGAVAANTFEQPQTTAVPVWHFSQPTQPSSENWEQDITELENFFTDATLPTQPVWINEYGEITDCAVFIKIQLKIVKVNNGNTTFLPYLDRLKELRQVLTSNQLM